MDVIEWGLVAVASFCGAMLFCVIVWDIICEVLR